MTKIYTFSINITRGYITMYALGSLNQLSDQMISNQVINQNQVRTKTMSNNVK